MQEWIKNYISVLETDYNILITVMQCSESKQFLSVQSDDVIN